MLDCDWSSDVCSSDLSIASSPTASIEVARKIRVQIAGELAKERMKPGDRLLAERKLAERYGVSYMTARRALQILVDEGCLERRQGQGVFVAPTVRTKGNDAPLCARALFYLEAVSGIYLRFMKALSRNLAAKGIELSWSMAEEVAQPEFLAASRSWSSDAFILVGMLPGAVVEHLRQAGRPLLVVDFRYDDLHADHLFLDNEGVGHEAARRLLATGRRRIGYAGGMIPPGHPLGQPGLRPEWPNSTRRGMGVRCALVERGIDRPETCFRPILWGADGRSALRAWLREPDRPDALICFSDVTARLAVEEARALGLRVPEDLAITALSESDTAPAESSGTVDRYRVDWAAVGEVAAQMLLARIESPSMPIRHSAMTFEHFAGDTMPQPQTSSEPT
jgi:DNA-binding LacI/PurR family transcriptional regulator